MSSTAKTLRARLCRARVLHQSGYNPNVASLFAFGANAALKRDALVLGQALEAGRLDVPEMGKQIGAACVRRDKAKALSVVEPFNDTGLLNTHDFFPLIKTIGNFAITALETKN
jgi:hypothetical protein